MQLCNGNSYKSIIAGLGLVALKQAQDVGMSADLTRGPRPREAVHDKWIMWIKWIKSRGEVEGNRTQLLHEFDGLTSTARASISESFSILFAKVTVGWCKCHPVSSFFTYLVIGWSTEAPVSRPWAPSWTSRATRDPDCPRWSQKKESGDWDPRDPWKCYVSLQIKSLQYVIWNNYEIC